MKTYEAIVKGESVPEPGVPESFKVLIKEFQSLGMDVKMLTINDEEVELRDLDEDDEIPAPADAPRLPQVDEGEETSQSVE